VYVKEYTVSSQLLIKGGGSWEKFIWLVVDVDFRKWQAGQSSDLLLGPGVPESVLESGKPSRYFSV